MIFFLFITVTHEKTDVIWVNLLINLFFFYENADVGFCTYFGKSALSCQIKHLFVWISTW